MTTLLDKMRIIVASGKRVELSEGTQESHFSFYLRYAHVVFNALQRPLFQKFLKWIMKREEIGEHKVKDVQIRVFPSIGKNGKGLAGKCDNKGRILLFPKRRRFLRRRIKKQGKADTEFYMKMRARAALIHEVLHLKYMSDEERVRELTKKYVASLTEKPCLQSQDAYKSA